MENGDETHSYDYENNEENEQKQEEKYTCPKCGQKVPYFLRYGKAPYVICPKCKGKFAKSQAPEGSILQKPKKYDWNPASVRTREEVEKLVKEEEPEVDIIRKPKTPEQVLKEVLEMFGVKPEFIKLAVIRSKRVGGLHPTDLRHMLYAFKNSGVNDKETAAYIADEYYYALMEEKRKAEELGINMTYPLGIESRERYYREFGGGTMYGLGYNQQTYGTQTSIRDRYQQMAQSSSNDRLVELLERVILEKGGTIDDNVRKELEELKMKMQEQRHQTDMRIMEIQQQFMNMMNSFKNEVSSAIKSLTDAIKEMKNTQPQVDVQKEIDLRLKDKEIQELKERMKEIMDLLREKEKMTTEERKMWMEKYEKLKEEYENKINEALRRQTADKYQTDSYRLIADSIDKAVEVARTKEPLKELAKIVLSSENIKQGKFKPKKVVSTEEDIFEYLNPEYVEGGE